MEAIFKQIQDIKAPIYKSVDYKLLKIKPDSRLTGTFYDSIIQAIYSTHKDFFERVSLERTGKLNCDVNIHMNNPITYEIMYDGDNKKTTPTIYFGIPENHATYMKQRIQGILPQSTLTFEDDYSDQFQDCYMCEYNYEKDSMLSLKIKDNNFLQAMLNLKNDIQKGEKILFQVEMTPISDMWKTFQDDKWDKVRKGKDAATKTVVVVKCFDMADNAVNEVLSVADDIMGVSNISSKKDSIDKKEKAMNMAAYTGSSKTKKGSDGFSVRIRAYFVCKSKLMAKTYATTIETAMRELEEDNRLVMGTMKTKSVTRGVSVKTFIPVGRNVMSAKELASIVNIPNHKLQREFKIDSVNMKVSEPPKECLDTNWVRMGTYENHGVINNVYFPKTKRNMCLTMLYITLMGGGKTSAVLNHMVDTVNVGNGIFVIDHIDDCPTTKALIDIFGSKMKYKDMSDNNSVFGLCYPEVFIEPTDDAETRLDKANDIAYEVEYFINNIAVNSEPITEIMSSYLFSACKVVFIHNYKTINDFHMVLINKKIRDEYIDLAIQQGVLTEDSFEVIKLHSLDDSDKEIRGVLNRLSVLTKDSLFQRMLRKPCDYNDSLINIFDNQTPFSVMLPQEYFSNKKKKDIITTFILSRVRLAMVRRKNKDKMCSVYIDEPQQLKGTMKVIEESIYEPRKFGLNYVFCVHALSQLDGLKEAVVSAGGHYLLLGGCTESAFNELKNKMPEDFTYEDITSMEKWHSLNVVTIDGKTHTFTSKLPEPLKDKRGKLYIDN